jgi:hypothetical protein
MPRTKTNFTPVYKRISKTGKRYDSSKAGYTRYTVHIEETTLKEFKHRCESESITAAEGISEAVRYWLGSF